MSEFYSYEGLRNGGTFLVDATTKTAIANSPTDIVGKVVTLTGNHTVGYGSAKDNPLGFVEQVEKENNNSGNLVVSVVWNQSREDIACAGTETAGAFAACNGSGGLQAAAAADGATSAKIWGADATNKVCTVYISG